MIVSTRIKSYNIRKFAYHIKHDLRENIPEYVDRERVSKNRYILFQDIENRENVKDWILKEWEFIQEDFKKHNNRKLRKDTGVIIEGIITFSKESRDFVNESNWNELDKRALEFIKTLEKEWNTKAVYLVRHSDEYTTHYHFAVMNYNYKTHQTIRAKLKKKDTSELQDKVANAFQDLGFVRGKHLAKRIEEEGEFANTRNWGSIFSIHKKLLHEMAELQDKEKELLEKIDKYERLVLKKEQQLEELEEKLRQRELQCEEKLKKGQRTLEKYLKRLEKAKKEYGEIIQLKNQLKQVLKELDRVKNENKSLKEENKLLKQKLEKSKEEIDKLKSELGKDKDSRTEESDIEVVRRIMKEVEEEMRKEKETNKETNKKNLKRIKRKPRL